MQVNKDNNNRMKNNIQEICMTLLLICSAHKEYIVWSTQTYCRNHMCNINKHINTITDLKITQWWNKICTGEIKNNIPI